GARGPRPCARGGAARAPALRSAGRGAPVRRLALALCLLPAACGRGAEDPAPSEGGEVVSAGLAPREDAGRCSLEGEGRFVTEHDTNGDGLPDVRQVFRGGEGGEGAAVLLCREVDLDGDGTKDRVLHF